jgi:2-polyprenyl-3-methyl-5-hydroxy-6-metoxy-1,4-benzoquinol methylase
MKQPIVSEISRRRKLRLLMKFLQPGASVLEVGAGSGWFSGQLRDHGYAVTTFDLVPPADLVGDINRWQELGIPPHSFDAVVALEVIEHVDCLATLRSVCKVGGLIMLSSPHPRWDWVMKLLELGGLTQGRTSAHDHLTDFADIAMPALLRQRPLLIHQVAIFRNEDPMVPRSSAAAKSGADDGHDAAGL